MDTIKVVAGLWIQYMKSYSRTQDTFTISREKICEHSLFIPWVGININIYRAWHLNELDMGDTLKFIVRRSIWLKKYLKTCGTRISHSPGYHFQFYL